MKHHIGRIMRIGLAFSYDVWKISTGCLVNINGHVYLLFKNTIIRLVQKPKCHLPNQIETKVQPTHSWSPRLRPHCHVWMLIMQLGQSQPRFSFSTPWYLA